MEREPALPGFREPALPGFREMAQRRLAVMAQRRQRLLAELVQRRQSAGLSQTEVAARMGTSQSSVARLEAGQADLRLSTLERYAAAVGSRLDWRVEEEKR
jgi:predicted transcriptional regulator